MGYGSGLVEIEVGKNESTPGVSRKGGLVKAETAKSSLDHVAQGLEHHAKEFGLNLLKNGNLGGFLARPVG